MPTYILKHNSLTVLNDDGVAVAVFKTDPYKDLESGKWSHNSGLAISKAPGMISHQNYNYHGTTDIDSNNH